MSSNSPIEWLNGRPEWGCAKGATWNWSLGCTPIRKGCGGCYAGKFATRHCANELQRDYYQSGIAEGGRFTGRVKVLERRLVPPYPWRRKPGLVFVNSMGDTFHDQVPFETIAAAYAVMACHPSHCFIVLTKRVERMVQFYEWHDENLLYGSPLALDTMAEVAGDTLLEYPWPLPNVVLCASCSTQDEVEEMAPYLLETPAACRGLSLEPLLERIEVPDEFLSGEYAPRDHGGVLAEQVGPRIDWIITGRETGARARPCDPQWVWNLAGQCDAYDAAFFPKKVAGYTAQGLDPFREYPEAIERLFREAA